MQQKTKLVKPLRETKRKTQPYKMILSSKDHFDEACRLTKLLWECDERLKVKETAREFKQKQSLEKVLRDIGVLDSNSNYKSEMIRAREGSFDEQFVNFCQTLE